VRRREQRWRLVREHAQKQYDYAKVIAAYTG
jgi:hypothetical protein